MRLHHVTSYNLPVAHANIMFCFVLFSCLTAAEGDRQTGKSVKMIVKKKNMSSQTLKYYKCEMILKIWTKYMVPDLYSLSFNRCPGI